MRPGVLDALADFIAGRAKSHPVLVITIFTFIAAPASAFMNSTPVVLVLIPVAVLTLIGIVAFAAFNVLPIGILALLGIAVVLALRCIDNDEA